MNLLKVERYKNKQRVEFRLAFIMLLIPLIMALSMRYTNIAYEMDYDKPGPITLFTLLISSLGMATSVGFFHIFLSIIAANSTAYELESGYYMMYFPKIKSKKKLLHVKQLVLFETVSILFFIFLLLGALFFKLIIIDTDRLSTKFFDDYSFYFVCTAIAMFFEVLLAANLSLILGLFLRPLQVIISSVAIFFLQVLLAEIPLVKFLIPKHYLQNLLNYGEWTYYPGVLKLTAISVLFSMGLIIVTTYVGRRKIEREFE